MIHRHINNFIYAMLFGFCCLYFYNLYDFPLYHDGPYLLPATNISGSDTLNYWFQIFSGPNHGPQYRPLSFFVFFKMMGSVLQNKIWQYHLVGSLLLFLCTFFFYKTLEKVKTNQWLNFFLTLLFLSSPYHSNISEITFIAKYYLPQLILILGFYICLSPELSNKKIVLLSLLSLVSIMNHEGSLTFFFVWLAYRYSNNLSFKKHHLFIAVPSIFYVFLRVYIFGVPGNGFMKINWFFMFESFETFMNYAWTGNTLENFYLYTFFLSLLTISVAMIGYRKNKNFLFILLFSIIIASPFMLLENHSTPDRVIWLSILPCLFIKELSREFRQNTLFLIITLAVTFFFEYKQIGSFVDIKKQAFDTQTENNAYVELINKTIDANQDIPIYIKLLVSNDSFSFMNIKTITGSVSLQRPKAKLLLNFSYPNIEESYEDFEFQILNGSSTGCFSSSIDFCKDIFLQKHKRLLNRQEIKNITLNL